MVIYPQNGFTALILASARGHHETVKALVDPTNKKPTDVLIKTKQVNMPPLHACMHAHHCSCSGMGWYILCGVCEHVNRYVVAVTLCTMHRVAGLEHAQVWGDSNTVYCAWSG